MFMTKYKVGDVVSVEFPFSDLQIQKRRPGLVLVTDDQDLLLARLTTSAACSIGCFSNPLGRNRPATTFDRSFNEAGYTRPSAGSS
jgi:hypothetical protein